MECSITGLFYGLKKWSSIEINCIFKNYGICIAYPLPPPNYGIFNTFFLKLEHLGAPRPPVLVPRFARCLSVTFCD